MIGLRRRFNAWDSRFRLKAAFGSGHCKTRAADVEEDLVFLNVDRPATKFKFDTEDTASLCMTRKSRVVTSELLVDHDSSGYMSLYFHGAAFRIVFKSLQ